MATNTKNTLAPNQIQKGSEIVAKITHDNLIIINGSDITDTKQLYKRLIMLNCSHPEHTLAQAILESKWKLDSRLAKENNNLFGMRIAKQRPTTNIAKSGSWAKYESKEKSVIDILLWQSYTGLRKGDNYFNHLKVSGYCPASDYIFDVQNVMESKGFKAIINEQTN